MPVLNNISDLETNLLSCVLGKYSSESDFLYTCNIMDERPLIIKNKIFKYAVLPSTGSFINCIFIDCICNTTKGFNGITFINCKFIRFTQTGSIIDNKFKNCKFKDCNFTSEKYYAEFKNNNFTKTKIHFCDFFNLIIRDNYFDKVLMKSSKFINLTIKNTHFFKLKEINNIYSTAVITNNNYTKTSIVNNQYEICQFISNRFSDIKYENIYYTKSSFIGHVIVDYDYFLNLNFNDCRIEEINTGDFSLNIIFTILKEVEHFIKLLSNISKNSKLLDISFKQKELIKKIDDFINQNTYLQKYYSNSCIVKDTDLHNFEFTAIMFIFVSLLDTVTAYNKIKIKNKSTFNKQLIKYIEYINDEIREKKENIKI